MGRRKLQSSKIEAVDLFCGAGGLSFGLKKEGIAVRAGYDLDPACEWPFEENVKSKFIRKDVSLVTERQLKKLYTKNSVRILAGCAPCQKFSSYTQKQSRSDRARWQLLDSFTRIALELRPEIITMENVPGLTRHKRFKGFIRALIDAGYQTSYAKIECAAFKMPQRRQRVVVLASRLGALNLLSPRQFRGKDRNVRDAIAKLPRVTAGRAHKSDPLHRAAGLSALNMRRIVASMQHGTWRDWPKELVLACHRKTSGTGYPSIYGRMSWTEKAPTITTNSYNYGSGRFGHPTQNRAITLRETKRSGAALTNACAILVASG